MKTTNPLTNPHSQLPYAIALVILALILILGVAKEALSIIKANAQPIEPDVTYVMPTIEPTTETEPVYIICDVPYTFCTPQGLDLYVETQDGNIHIFSIIEDYPEGGISEVCLKANDIEDYTTYEVVAIR